MSLLPRSISASTASPSGRATLASRAAIPIAERKQADQPAANSCSGLVPLPAPPGVVRATCQPIVIAARGPFAPASRVHSTSVDKV